jgi:hypothetical protein
VSKKPLAEVEPDHAGLWIRNVSDDPRTPEVFTKNARVVCLWRCDRGVHDNYEASPRGVRWPDDNPYWCPRCSTEYAEELDRNFRVEREARLAKPVSSFPLLVAAWSDSRPFEGLILRDLIDKSAPERPLCELRCPEGHKVRPVFDYAVTGNCPICRGLETRRKNASIPQDPIAVVAPFLRAWWATSRNGCLKPDSTPHNHRAPIWWRCPACNHEWSQKLRETGARRPFWDYQATNREPFCPSCGAITGCVGDRFPHLAKEWHPENTVSPWFVLPSQAGAPIGWQCLSDSSHVWSATVASRAAGGGCPQCNGSKIERSIRLALTEAGVRFTSQQTHAAYLSLGPLFMDFWLDPQPGVAVPTIIEGDGEQHFGPVDLYGGQARFDEAQRRDAVKNATAAALGHRLVRVTDHAALAFGGLTPDEGRARGYLVVPVRDDAGAVLAVLRSAGVLQRQHNG